MAPDNPHIIKTFDGEYRSAIVNNAKTNEPIIKPNCTAEVRCPRELSANPKVVIRSSIIPLPANQSEVQLN